MPSRPSHSPQTPSTLPPRATVFTCPALSVGRVSVVHGRHDGITYSQSSSLASLQTLGILHYVSPPRSTLARSHGHFLGTHETKRVYRVDIVGDESSRRSKAKQNPCSILIHSARLLVLSVSKKSFERIVPAVGQCLSAISRPTSLPRQPAVLIAMSESNHHDKILTRFPETCSGLAEEREREQAKITQTACRRRSVTNPEHGETRRVPASWHPDLCLTSLSCSYGHRYGLWTLECLLPSLTGLLGALTTHPPPPLVCRPPSTNE